MNTLLETFENLHNIVNNYQKNKSNMQLDDVKKELVIEFEKLKSNLPTNFNYHLNLKLLHICEFDIYCTHKDFPNAIGFRLDNYAINKLNTNLCSFANYERSQILINRRPRLYIAPRIRPRLPYPIIK